MDLLWTDFLNSMWHDWRGSGRSEDRLEKPAWLERFTATWNLNAPLPLQPEELDALKKLRTLLGRMAENVVAGFPLHPDDLQQLNQAMARSPVTRQLVRTDGKYRLELVPLRQDWVHAMADIAASFALTLAEGDDGRIRICDNPHCRWVFIDSTRNRSKRFCDDKLCGNLMKVRRFRARKQSSDHAESGRGQKE